VETQTYTLAQCNALFESQFGAGELNDNPHIITACKDEQIGNSLFFLMDTDQTEDFHFQSDDGRTIVIQKQVSADYPDQTLFLLRELERND
jgi:hypothetical protein